MLNAAQTGLAECGRCTWKCCAKGTNLPLENVSVTERIRLDCQQTGAYCASSLNCYCAVILYSYCARSLTVSVPETLQLMCQEPYSECARSLTVNVPGALQ